MRFLNGYVRTRPRISGTMRLNREALLSGQDTIGSIP